MSARPPNIGRALAGAVRAVPGLARSDAAAVALAKHYAAVIDEGDDEALAAFGPRLLAVLDQLRLTPKARQSVLTGGATNGDGDQRRAALRVLRGEHGPRED